MTPPRLLLVPVLVLLSLVLGVSPGAVGSPLAPAGPDPIGVWPLSPEPGVEHGFDPPQTRWGRGHRGVDLAGHVGQLVRTALPGTVLYAGRLAGRGVVVVGHGPTRTTYEPVAATVGVGEAVARGDPIGRLELGGSHCFPAACLHWGWLRGDVYLDPLRLVGAVPVRLWPWSRPSSGGAPLGRTLLPYAGWQPPLDRGTVGFVRRGGAPADRPGAAARW